MSKSKKKDKKSKEKWLRTSRPAHPGRDPDHAIGFPGFGTPWKHLIQFFQVKVFLVHADVLDLLDNHLAELQALRRDLTSPRPAQPGERHDIAAATLHSTRYFVAELEQILREVHEPKQQFSGDPVLTT